MPSPIFLSKPSSGFTLSSIARGTQLAFVGTYRALQNPDLARHGYYQKAAKAALYSLAFEWCFRFLFNIIRALLRLFHAKQSSIDDLVWGLDNVLQFRQLLLFLLKDAATMDDLFLMSLTHVDHTNTIKHPDTERLYGRLHDIEPVNNPFRGKKTAIKGVILKYARRIKYSVLTWALSSVPLVGKWVLPAAAFHSFKNVAGTPAALVIFGIGVICPRWWTMTFLTTYWGTRSMMNDLLSPYFSRLPFSLSTKKLWYENRQGILFGFGAIFYLSTKLPYAGLFLYGMASASAAYLVTKVSDPIPKYHLHEWTEEQAVWTSRDRKALPSETHTSPSNSRTNSRTASPARGPFDINRRHNLKDFDTQTLS